MISIFNFRSFNLLCTQGLTTWRTCSWPWTRQVSALQIKGTPSGLWGTFGILSRNLNFQAVHGFSFIIHIWFIIFKDVGEWDWLQVHRKCFRKTPHPLSKHLSKQPPKPGYCSFQDGSGELTLEEINNAPEETRNQLKAEGEDLAAKWEW